MKSLRYVIYELSPNTYDQLKRHENCVVRAKDENPKH